MSTVDSEPSGVFNIVTSARVGGRVITHVYQMPPAFDRRQTTALKNKWAREDRDPSKPVVRYSVCESIRIVEP